MNNKFLIIYHNEDNDGLFSAALFNYYLAHDLKINSNDIIEMGSNYNELAKIDNKAIHKWKEEYSHIILLDLSFNDIKKMKLLKKEFGNNFIWIDHHSPIIVESVFKKFDDINGIRQTDRSTILLVCKYCWDQLDENYNKKNIPELLRILSAYDSFTYEKEGYDLETVNCINKAVTNETQLDLNRTKMVVFELMNDPDYPSLTNLYKLGLSLDKYDVFKNKIITDNYGDCSWKVNDNPACAIFCQGPSNSLMFNGIDVKHGIVFKRNKNATWTISLYNVKNDEKFHCGEYLKQKYSGGGHSGAAGCQIDENKFIEILKCKKI